ncbi:hypothetical protein, partial [Stenotrophomonas maltophilia]|uniref:hypothetical protein n=1 Tax=Stenotrophomonas maltophilia TaxID=40324 RepID=UPI0013DB79C1
FGALSEAVEALFAMARLRVDCVRLGVARLTGGPEGVAADLRPGVRPGPMPAADGLVQRDGRVVLRRPAEDETARLALATRLLEHLRKAAERSA